MGVYWRLVLSARAAAETCGSATRTDEQEADSKPSSGSLSHHPALGSSDKEEEAACHIIDFESLRANRTEFARRLRLLPGAKWSVTTLREKMMIPTRPLHARGLPAKCLREFVQKYPKALSMTTGEVVGEIIKKETASKLCRFCDLDEFSGVVGDAEIFVSHCWGANFGDLIAGILNVCEDETMVWLDIFAVFQHRVDVHEVLHDSTVARQQGPDLSFEGVIDKVRCFLLVMTPSKDLEEIKGDDILSGKDDILSESIAKTLPPQRIWCLYELFHAMMYGKPVVVQAGHRNDATQESNDDTQESLEFKPCNRDVILNILKLVDVEKARATVEEDRLRILRECKEKYTFATVNATVKGSVTGAMASIMAEYDLTEVPRATVTNNKESLRAAVATWNPQHRQEAFFCAVGGNFTLAVDVIVKAGIDANVRGEGGDVALHWAAQGGQLEMINRLVANGANVNVQNMVGWTAIVWATTDGQQGSIDVLKEKGADLNVQSEQDGITALMWSVATDKIECLRKLCELGADVELKSKRGVTAAFYAMSGGKPKVLEVLLDKGADKNARLGNRGDGMTMAMWAAENGETEMLKILKDRDADLSITLSDGRNVETIQEAYKKGKRPPSPCDVPEPEVSRSDNRVLHYVRKLEARLFAH